MPRSRPRSPAALAALALALALACVAPRPALAQVSPKGQTGATESTDSGPAAGDPPLAGALVEHPVEAPARGEGLSALPLVSYSPETHVAIGGFAVYYFRLGGAPPTTRPSYVAGAGVYTTRLQTLVDLFPDLWLDDERFHVSAVLNVRDFPDSFFGVGPTTPAEREERYTLQGVRDQIDATVRVAGALHVGIRQELQWYRLTDLSPDGQLALGTVVGAAGGVRSGLGLTVAWDGRDSALAARRGGFYQAAVTTYQPWLGSDYRYARLVLDARQFLPLGGDHVLALQAYAELTAGDVPFQSLGQLGGASRLRGWFEGRYRDKDYAMAQIEYRTPIFLWRFGLAAFAAAGAVAPRLDAFSTDAMRWAVGAGVRFALDPAERIHTRLDLGVGPGTWGLYFNVLEAF